MKRRDRSWIAPSTKSLRFALALQLVVALTVCAPCQNSSEREISFENSRRFGLLLVKGEVDDTKAVFILDTGSSITAISSEMVKVSAHGAHRRFTSKKGSGIVRSGVFAKTKLKLGTITCFSHDVVVMNMKDISDALGQRVDGILGLDFLGELTGVELGVKNHRLVLDP